MSYNPQNPNGQASSANSAPVVLSTEQEALIGALTETAPATDTASSGLNGRLQRVAQNLTSLLTGIVLAAGSALIGKVQLRNPGDTADLGDTANPVRVDPTGTTAQPVTVASLPLPSGAATEGTLASRLSETDFDTKTGSLTETAPSTDTASSGLNGRLQRIAQRLTSIISLLPAALVGGRFDVNVGAWLGSTAPTVGSKTSANSVPVVIASDQASVAVSNSGLTSLNAAIKNEDTASGNLDLGFPAMAIQKATPADTAADGDYVMLQITGGKLWAQASIDQTTDGTTNKVAATQATAANLNAQVVGDVAHDTTDAGKPVKIGAQARQTNPTAVGDADRVNVFADDLGRLVVVPHQARDLVTDATTTISASSSETTILAAVANIFLDVTAMTFANTSATGVRVDIRDTTGGSVKFSFWLPANDTRGIVFQVPKPQTTVNTNWTAQLSASVTDVRIFVQAVKNV